MAFCDSVRVLGRLRGVRHARDLIDPKHQTRAIYSTDCCGTFTPSGEGSGHAGNENLSRKMSRALGYRFGRWVYGSQCFVGLVDVPDSCLFFALGGRVLARSLGVKSAPGFSGDSSRAVYGWAACHCCVCCPEIECSDLSFTIAKTCPYHLDGDTSGSLVTISLPEEPCTPFAVSGTLSRGRDCRWRGEAGLPCGDTVKLCFACERFCGPPGDCSHGQLQMACGQNPCGDCYYGLTPACPITPDYCHCDPPEWRFHCQPYSGATQDKRCVNCHDFYDVIITA